MKKLLCLVLVLLTAMSLLAGCGGNGGGGSNRDPNVITVGIMGNAMISDYNDNYFTQYLEEKTGFDIQIVQEFTGSVTDAQTVISTMVSGGETLPDIIIGVQMSDDLRSSYGQQGYFIDLKPFYDNKELSKTWWDSFELLDKEQQNWFYHKIEDEDTGEWYSIPMIPSSEWDVLHYQPWINQEWLDKLGKKVPTNTEELVDVLTAFRDGDPNGNSQKDEIPCMGSTNLMGGDVISWLINMKTFCDKATWVAMGDDGKVYAPAVTDEYREALKWVYDLMQQGLVSPLSVSTPDTGLKANLAAGDIIGLFLGHPQKVAPSAEQMEKWTPVPIWGNMTYEYNEASYRVFITEDCPHPENAWKVLMEMCSQESAIIQRYGIQGQHWDYADEGALTTKGTPALIKVYSDIYGETRTNAFWRSGTCGAYSIRNMDELQVNDTTTEEYKFDQKILKMITSSWNAAEANNPDNMIPRLMWANEHKKACPYRTEVTKVFTNYRSKFVFGQLNPYNDEHWQRYLDELDAATYKTWITTVQKVVDDMIADGMYNPNP